MTTTDGILSVQTDTLTRICEAGHVGENVWVGINWTNGEIDEAVLVVELDPYCDVDTVTCDGKTFALEFDNEIIGATVANYGHLPRDNRPPLSVALRYVIEFDAQLSESGWPVGGKWTWGGMRGRPEKRNPEDFYERWRTA